MPVGSYPIDYTYPLGLGERTGYSGWSQISLSDIIMAPDAAARQIVSNVRQNALPFAVSATVFEFGQRGVRKLLSRPINKINSMVFTGKNAPLRGMGVRL